MYLMMLLFIVIRDIAYRFIMIHCPGKVAYKAKLYSWLGAVILFIDIDFKLGGCWIVKL